MGKEEGGEREGWLRRNYDKEENKIYNKNFNFYVLFIWGYFFFLDGKSF